MKKKSMMAIGFVTTLLSAALILAPSLFAETAVNNKDEPTSATRLEALSKFSKVISIVERYNVDKVTIEELMNKAMEGMLSNLDAHSTYLDEKHFENLKVQTDGEFGGLGITVGIRDGVLTVIAPIEGTPADKAGLKSGDIILKIDKKSSLNMAIDEAVGLMRGKPKTPITLTIVRKKERKPLTINIIRDIIKIDSVYAKKINGDILYLRVTNFDKKVTKELKKHLKRHLPLRKGIILDLRNNPGGLLDQAVGVVDLFVDKGVIVSQKGRNEQEHKEYKANLKGTYKNIPVVVLINGGSASASEIVSGALQDHNRAIIVGEKSFGKGSVQVILPVAQKEAIKLTIARYYLPSGRTIQAVGVTPNIEVGHGTVQESEESELAMKEADLKKHLEGELEKVNSTNEKDRVSKNLNLKKDTITKKDINKDLQLKTAVDILTALIITKG